LTSAKLVRACALLLVAVFVHVAHAGTITATINEIAPNKVWGGVMVQLSGSSTYADCQNTSWAYFATTDPMHNAWLAVLLTAKVSGAAVTITTTGCATGVPGVVAQVTVVEFK